MPDKAMNVLPDSQNPTAPAVSDMPLYILAESGQFYALDVEDTPCYVLTGDGRHEMHLARIRATRSPGVQDEQL